MSYLPGDLFSILVKLEHTRLLLSTKSTVEKQFAPLFGSDSVSDTQSGQVVFQLLHFGLAVLCVASYDHV